MNYYERHIGDYLKDTAHLSLLEHGVYGRLLDVYYSREGAIPVEQAERLIGARSKEERAALAAVLDEFFTVDAGALRHERCERELARFRDKQRKASASANARWNKQPEHTERTADAMRTHTERNADGMLPVTSNQTPDPIQPPTTPRKRGSAGCWGFDAFWQVYPNKTAKQAAAKAFDKIAPSTDLLDEILQAVARQKTWPKWVKDGGQYIPNPATWLNAQQWLDEPPPVGLTAVHETPRQKAAIDAAIAFSGGILNVRRARQETIDADANLPALG